MSLVRRLIREMTEMELVQRIPEVVGDRKVRGPLIEVPAYEIKDVRGTMEEDKRIETLFDSWAEEIMREMSIQTRVVRGPLIVGGNPGAWEVKASITSWSYTSRPDLSVETYVFLKNVTDVTQVGNVLRWSYTDWSGQEITKEVPLAGIVFNVRLVCSMSVKTSDGNIVKAHDSYNTEMSTSSVNSSSRNLSGKMIDIADFVRRTLWRHENGILDVEPEGE